MKAPEKFGRDLQATQNDVSPASYQATARWEKAFGAGFRRRRAYAGYMQSVLLVLLAILVSIVLHRIKPVNMVMIYLTVVVYAGLFLGRGPAVLASLLSVLAFDFLQVDPRLSLTVADPEDLLTFFGLFLVGVVVSSSAERLRHQVTILRTRQAHLAALNSLSGDLARAISLEDLLYSIVSRIEQIFNYQAAIWLPEAGGLRVAFASQGMQLSDLDLEAAQASFAGARPCGFGVPGCIQSAVLCLHLETSAGVVGVLGVLPGQPSLAMTDDQRLLLDGFANLAALAIERARLAEQASQAKILENTERLQTALLHSISHELRTPLVSITGALSTLVEAKDEVEISAEDQAAHRELIDTAYEEAQRLNMLVGNLLDMSRLEAGVFRLSLEPCDPQDLVGIVLARFTERHSRNPVQVELEDDLPLVHIDVALMVQVLLNLLDNAVKYSPQATPVEIAGKLVGEELHLSVADCGIGIPTEELNKVFEKFYRSARSAGISGIGLGLSICKGIVEAHGGRIWGQDRKPAGTLITIGIPVNNKVIGGGM